MERKEIERIALAVVASKKPRVGENDPVDENAAVTAGDALNLIKEEAQKDAVGALSGGETNDLAGMAKKLGVPLSEYLNFREEIGKALQGETEGAK